eukprot:m.18731 g.18731  ORF g.18731 m.18731 type:complete len:357 (-) comp3623_c0_seq1:83-1153(-)
MATPLARAAAWTRPHVVRCLATPSLSCLSCAVCIGPRRDTTDHQAMWIRRFMAVTARSYARPAVPCLARNVIRPAGAACESDGEGASEEVQNQDEVLTDAEKVAAKAVQAFSDGKIEFAELEKILDEVNLAVEHDDTDDDHDHRGSDNNDHMYDLGVEQRRPATPKSAAKRVLEDPSVAAAFEDNDGLHDGARSTRPTVQTAARQLITFRLGRMPDTLATAGSGVEPEGIEARGKVRHRRIGAAMRKALVEGLRRGQLGTVLPELGVEIDEVELSRGLRTATVWWHSLGDEVDREVATEIRELRGQPRTLARRLNLKFTPDVRWKPTVIRDDSERLDALFADVESELRDAEDRGVV